MERDLVRLVAGMGGCIFLYQSFDSFLTMRLAKEPAANIVWGLSHWFSDSSVWRAPSTFSRHQFQTQTLAIVHTHDAR
jgi:hypothetical protein